MGHIIVTGLTEDEVQRLGWIGTGRTTGASLKVSAPLLVRHRKAVRPVFDPLAVSMTPIRGWKAPA